MTCLVVREGRPIGVNNFLVEPEPVCVEFDSQCETCGCWQRMYKYEAAHEAALESAVDCADQDEAGGMIVLNHPDRVKYRGSYAVGIKPGVYPIPGLSFRVETQYYHVSVRAERTGWKPCKDKCDIQYRIDRGQKVRTVAILSLEQSPKVSAAPVYGTEEGKLYVKPEELFAIPKVQEIIQRAADMKTGIGRKIYTGIELGQGLGTISDRIEEMLDENAIEYATKCLAFKRLEVAFLENFLSAAVPKGEGGEDQAKLWKEARKYMETWNIDALFKTFHITRKKDQ